MVNGVPRFFSMNSSEKTSSLGLTSRLFESPFLYDKFEDLLALVAGQQKLGIKDLTDNHSLLNIGCGPNVEAKYREYDIHTLSSFAACDVSTSFVETALMNCRKRPILLARRCRFLKLLTVAP